MVFKLVRTDTEEPCKILLPVGKHIIGRGKLLDCEDKRVSRNHGELEVTVDSVVIRALHQNPCFILKKNTSESQILRQSCALDITNGDKFGLLPDSYWYELLHSVDIDIDSDVEHDIDNSVNQDSEEDTESMATESTETFQIGSENQNNVNDLNNTLGNNNPGSPSLLTETQLGNEEHNNIAHSPNEDPSSGKNFTNNEKDEDNGTEDRVQIKKEPDTPTKRSCSPDRGSNDPVKKIKTEPEMKQDPDEGQAGPSNNHVDSNSDDNGKDQNSPQSPPNSALRERCMYGASCYRRNPQHKAQFSHPSDADWGTGAQVPCPYGASCNKVDPRHWRDHSHPPGVRPRSPPQANLPPMNRAGNKRREPKPIRRNSSDDDDSPTPGLIVQGKRIRKVVNRPNWSGSESENEDPFGTDESDEWQPSSDMTNSQLYSQDM